VATKLQKDNLLLLLEKYGVVRISRDTNNWVVVSISTNEPKHRTAYSAHRKGKYPAMKDALEEVRITISEMIRIIELY